jgi:hypothetical protein
VSEIALAALYRAVGLRLSNGSAIFADRAYADYSESDEYPYVIYFWSGGGEVNHTRRRDAEIVLTVTAISEKLGDAQIAAQQISDLLNDSGEYDDPADYLYGGTFWRILTSTEEDAIHTLDMFSGAVPIYHVGARYRFVMEVK